ncbi:hypothetical protein LTR86_003870 [Recurvomyces mirabilis]|nr:hypothetical protein LTR86_003870 [Recurvomyces mirabilis]
MAYGGRRAGKTGGRRRCIIITSIIVALAVIAIAIGLGVGLGRNHGGGSSSGSSSASPASGTSLPSPPANGSIYQPAVNSTWQIVLQNPINVSTAITPHVDVYDIDMFTNPQSTIQSLQQAGMKVICYFSAGSYEPNRPDSGDFQAADKGKELAGWPGEYWLNLNSTNVRQIMVKRMQLAAQKGCDAVDPDNMDGYSNNNGLGLTQQDSIDFMQFLAGHARNLSLAIGLKNAGDIVQNVLPVVQFSVNEQYSECATFAPFVTAGKPVFNIEYPSGAGSTIAVEKYRTICTDSGNAANSTDFSKVMKTMDLTGWVEYCNGSVFDTAMSSS